LRRFWQGRGISGRGVNSEIPIVWSLPVEGIGLEVIQAFKHGPRIMRYQLADFEWATIKPTVPNKPRGVPRARSTGGVCPYTTCYNRFVRWRRVGI
jgi:hypothetical protein